MLSFSDVPICVVIIFVFLLICPDVVVLLFKNLILNVLRIIVVLLCNAVEYLLRDVFIAVNFFPYVVYIIPLNGNYIVSLKKYRGIVKNNR